MGPQCILTFCVGLTVMFSVYNYMLYLVLYVVLYVVLYAVLSVVLYAVFVYNRPAR